MTAPNTVDEPGRYGVNPSPGWEKFRTNLLAPHGPATAPPAPPAPPPTGGNGGGAHNDGMEPRIANIETRLTRVETKLDHIDKEVSQVKWWIIVQIAAAFATVFGTGVAIQQMTVATFQGAAQLAKEAAPAAVQQPPIIINVPGATPAPAAPIGK